MVSTVTSTTVTTVTLLGITGLLGMAAVIMLIAYLAAKELLNASPSPTMQTAARSLNVAVIPLMVVFATIVATRVMDVLG
ncbi:MAG: hypothetical protein HYS09_01475 [Chloroflexi bacterium]|nr:hypothetical protein [Chloroflexota bacterium]